MALPFTRPFLFGERYAVVGVGLAFAAALAATVADRDGDRRMDPAARALLAWLALQWAWLLVLPILHPSILLPDTAKGLVTVPAVVAAGCLVLRDQERRIQVARGIIAGVLICCASYVITAASWATTGVGSLVVTEIPASYEASDGHAPTYVPVHFPLTTVLSAVDYSGVVIPRFLGLGREPGVMACLIVWSIFTAHRLRMRRRWTLLLLVGLAGTQSTAGFGVLLLVWVLAHVLVIPARYLNTGLGAARQAVGVGLLFAAAYLAVWAPAFGLEAKREVNPASVSDRQDATVAGIHALIDAPFGTDPEDHEGRAGINVIAATTIVGTVGTTLAILTLVRPLMLSRDRRDSLGGGLTIIATVLFAQPLLQSTGFYLLLAIAVGGGPSGGSGRGGVGDEPQRGELSQERVQSGVATAGP
jgi:hypothetical protein